MPRLGSVLLFALLLSASLLGGVTGSPSVFNAGVWVQHPGVAVGKLRPSDTQMTTVVGDTNGYLHAWYPNGTERSGFPKLLSDQTYATTHGGTAGTENYFVNSTPTLVDINGDGDLEIFVGSGDGWVYGLRPNGTNLPGWPQFTGISLANGLYGVFASPTVADVDSDGTLEVIVGAWSHYMYVWNADGSVQPGWPFDNTDTIWSSAAVADFDRDGYLEIVVGGDWTEPLNPVNGGGGVLRMFRYDGTEMTGWPQRMNQVIWSSPAIGDVDDDGDLDIIVGTGNFYLNRAKYVNGYDWQGNTLPGWPVVLNPPVADSRLGVFASPALVDLDADGKLEVLIGDMLCVLRCINYDGSVRWSRQVGTDINAFVQFSSPAVGDIDGDGRLEVVTGGGWHLFAFDALTGAPEAGYPIETGYPDLGGTPMVTWSSPTIADVDGDGLVEILIGNGRKDWSPYVPPSAGGVRVFHESGTAVPSGQVAGPTGVAWSVAPWPRFRRGNTGTGSLSDAPSAIGGTEPLISASSAVPFIFSPNADGIDDNLTLNFTLTEADTMTLEVLDHAGGVVRRILTSQHLGAGSHSYSWDGLTQSGARANDGMHRYRIYGDRASVVEGVFGLNNTIPQVSRSWYLAEGSTVGFEAYVLVQNPNDLPTNVNVTFFRQDGTTKTYAETVSARTRTTVAIHGEVPNTYSVSTQVEADLPIIVERAMYFMKNGRAGHDSTGSTQTSTTWYFPANRTFSGDEDFILITNPSAATATVAVTYYLDNQAPVEQVHTVYPTSRYTVAVHAYFAAQRVSVRLVSDLPIASERAFYFGARTGGSAGIGAVSPSLTWYFAEGDTINTSYLEMFNPSSLPANVTINFLREDGIVVPRNYVLAAERRLTVDASTVLGTGVRFSAEIVSTQPIVAERMVFTAQDCGDSIGSPTPDFVWNLAEGFTAFGYQTWVVISNPGTQSASVTVRLMLQSGDNIVENYILGAKTRRTVYLNDVVSSHFPGTPGTSVSTQVTSDQPIVVERTMKFDSGRGMHQAMGVRQ